MKINSPCKPYCKKLVDTGEPIVNRRCPVCGMGYVMSGHEKYIPKEDEKKGEDDNAL